MKTLTHRLARRKEKNVEHDEEEHAMWRGSIYSFILFIQQNKQGSGLCCSSDSSASITVKFQIRGFALPTFLVTSKPACCFPSPLVKYDYLDFYRLHKLQIKWKKTHLFESSSELKEILASVPDLWSCNWTLDGAIQLARNLQSQTWFACGSCGPLAWLEYN